jgi:two-component system response regulator RegA
MEPDVRRTILVVEDDAALRARLVRAFFERGFEVRSFELASRALDQAAEDPPELALVDLRLPDGSGLDVLRRLKEIEPSTSVVMLTGWGSIANAMEAVRLGATHYVTKPAGIDEILAAFARRPEDSFLADASPGVAPSLATAEWEHIQRVLADCGGNISQTARRLGMHRRSLQRKLARPPDEV